MCPTKEVEFRIAKCLVHPLESANPWENVPAEERIAVQGRMVKEYSRPAAGTKGFSESQLRPFPILMRTIKYLLR